MKEVCIKRETLETSITIKLNMLGTGKSHITTGIGFFDHMLTHIAKHSLIDLNVDVKGDLEIDGHHTVEDTGLALGMALKEALGNREGIQRYGHRILPMDEALILCALDLSGRPYVEIDTPFRSPYVGQFDTQLVEAFFSALGIKAGMNLHIQVLKGRNDHHIIEGMCKAFGKALLDATTTHPRIQGVPSTKGVLEV